MPHTCETPPPPAPGSKFPASAPALPPPFHTTSLGGGPRALIVVPPTAVTNGWLAGSSTASDGFGSEPLPLQSSDPSSPAADTIDWPWTAASSNSVFSAFAAPEPSSGSHWPQELVITLARSCEIAALHVSYGPDPEPLWFEFGPSYTRTLAWGANPIACSMSSAASPEPTPLPAPPSTDTLETAATVR